MIEDEDGTMRGCGLECGASHVPAHQYILYEAYRLLALVRLYLGSIVEPRARGDVSSSGSGPFPFRVAETLGR
jgi:hypothetical protein